MNQVKWFLCAGVMMSSASVWALKVRDRQVLLESLKDYEFCQTQDYNGDICYEALQRWVGAHPDDAFEAGKLVRKTMNHHAAVPFFSQAFAAKKGTCDEDVRMAVISGLGLPSETSQDTVTKSRDIAFGQCFDAFKTEIVAEVSSSKPYFLKNACTELLKRKAITGLKATVCQKAK